MLIKIIQYRLFSKFQTQMINTNFIRRVLQDFELGAGRPSSFVPIIILFMDIMKQVILYNKTPVIIIII